MSRIALAGLLLALSLPAAAQAPSARDFARWGEVYEVSLSPDGKYVAMTVPTADNRETQLKIVPLDVNGQSQVLRFGKMEHVADIAWTADDRVTVARATNLPLRPRPYSTGQLFSADVTGKAQKTLFGFFRDSGMQTGRRKDEGFAQLAKVLDRQPGHAIIAFTCWDCGEKPDLVLYDVDTATGERREMERLSDVQGYYLDQDGRARVIMRRTKDDRPQLFYRPTQDAQWQPMPKSLAGYNIGSLTFAADNNTAYAAVSDGGEAERFYKLDFRAGTRTPLPSKPGYDIAYVLREGRNGVPFAVVSDGGKPSIQYLDPSSEWAQLHAGLMKAFAGQLVSFNGFSRDNRKVLFRTWSDRNPGAWYLLDRDTNQYQLVVQPQSWLKPESLAHAIPLEVTTRDGQIISALVTLPRDGPLPMVVLPHGGPFGVYDTWGYDSDAQFLASRGYAVLQVNFRGSGGRGESFQRLGEREWGGKMQDDIADAVKFAIAQKVADPQRICTFGASYGGYASLMQAIRYPELYKCAVGYAGVYDLSLMHRAGDIPETASGRRYLDRVLGSDKAVLAANSPARNIDKIKVPVLLVHGTIDRRVPMDQFNALKSAMQGAGVKLETMVADGEGHGFYGVDNRAKLYEKLAAFLDQNIGKNAK